MGNGYHLCPLIQHVLVFVDDQLAPVVHRYHTDDCPTLIRQDLPRNDVRVVFHLADEYLVTLADEFATIRICDEIYALGGPADEYALFGFAGVDKAFYLFAGRLVGGSRVLR